MLAIVILKFIVFIGLSVGGFLIVHKMVHHSIREKHNEIAGFIFGTVGVIYAVLLAFIVVTVWSEYTDTERSINAEASHIVDIYRNADAFPDSIKKDIHTACVHYINDLIQFEWPAMKKHNVSEEATNSYLALWKIHQTFIPQNTFEDIWYAESVRELNMLGDARTHRINAINYNLHPFMWFVLIFGAIITIAVSYMFGTMNKVSHIVMIVGLSTSICMILIMAEGLVHPFSSIIKIEPDAFVLALKQLL
jgi:phage-related holin